VIFARRLLAAATFAALTTLAHPAHAETEKPAAPPSTWREYWFEHNQLLQRVAYNDEVAVYFDNDVKRDGTDWILPFMTKLWRYTKETYGAFGKEGRLYAIFHQGKYAGGHPSTYFDASHDSRDVTDCGPGPWDTPKFDMPSHEVSHIVEGASDGIHGSPAFDIWGDSKWAEFYQYDAYVALGMDADAKRLYDRFTKGSDSFPRPGTYWFRDWFYPLWHDHGHVAVMVRFFHLLASYFPKAKEEGGSTGFARQMNWGEYVHFMSGAAKTDLKPLATKAFGWPPEREAQYQKARTDFPQIAY
jgi:hypothetical protein